MYMWIMKTDMGTSENVTMSPTESQPMANLSIEAESYVELNTCQCADCSVWSSSEIGCPTWSGSQIGDDEVN